MAKRIKELEDALASLYELGSTEPHPLLQNKSLSIKDLQGLEESSSSSEFSEELEVLDALGTMTIGDQGRSTYFGRSAGCEVSVTSE